VNTGLLILRLTVAIALAPHGAQKLFGWFAPPGRGGIQATSAAFAHRWRSPALCAVLAGLCELGGAIALAGGLLAPLAAAAVMGVMIVATASNHWTKGFLLSRGGFEYNFVLIGGAAAVAFIGPGKFSLDWTLGWHQRDIGWGFGAVGLAAVAATVQVLAFLKPAETAPAPPTPSAPAAAA
jgi:putative oxidoreductase